MPFRLSKRNVLYLQEVIRREQQTAARIERMIGAVEREPGARPNRQLIAYELRQLERENYLALGIPCLPPQILGPLQVVAERVQLLIEAEEALEDDA